MVHKQFHMVPDVRRAALTTPIALLLSFLSISSPLYSPSPLHFRGPRLAASFMPSVFLFRLCLRNCYIYIYILSACARLRHPREEIWRGMRTFHNRYRVLNVLVSIRHVNFPFTMTSTKISTGFVLYIYIHRSNSLFSSYLPCQV